MTLRIGSLFSGYGGLDIAVSSVLDVDVAWHVEFDRAPSLVLDHHWPDVRNYGDVTQCDWASMPAVDIITGGSPCQDLSAAGRRAGMTEGTRSNLWVNMREAIATIRPGYVIWENVLGALSATAASASDMVADAGPLGNPGDGHLRALGRVLGDLAEIGYDARWTTLRASDIGAPHHRARVFLLATPTDAPGGGRERREGGNARRWDASVGCEAGGRADRPAEDAADADGVGCGQGAEQPGDGRADDLLTCWASGRPGSGRCGEPTRSDVFAGIYCQCERDVLVLPTPVAQPSGNTPENHLRKKPGRSVVTDLSILVENDLLASGGVVLPTPTVGNATGTNERRGGKRSDELLLPGVVAAHAAGEFLPTPRAMEAEQSMGSPGAARHVATGNGGLTETIGVVLPTPTGQFLPSPTASDASGGGMHPDHPGRQGHTMQLPDYVLLADEPDRWGKYAPAIRRWEAVLGRPAPAPTEPNANGRPRLNARFAEWMMGLPSGWVTAPEIGISRAEQLKAIGNGVCPQQAAAALRELFAMPAGEAA